MAALDCLGCQALVSLTNPALTLLLSLTPVPGHPECPVLLWHCWRVAAKQGLIFLCAFMACWRGVCEGNENPEQMA